MKQKIRKLFTHNASLLTHHGSKGFTLIEIAMVLVVIGILLTIGAGLVSVLTKKAKFNESKEVVKAAREAVIGYAVKNGYLPVTLEDAGAKGFDTWANALQFYRASELTGGDACGINTTTMTVYECVNADCSSYNQKSNIAFVVYSRGADGNGACTGSSSPFYVREQDMGYNSPCIYAPSNPQFNYDDIVAYASLDEIRSLRGCPQPLAITSPSVLAEGEEDSFYSYSLQAIGGKPPYTWSGSAGSGLTLNSAGLISGTINVNTASGTGELTACSASISVSATVNDSAGSPPQNYSASIPVRPKPLTIITQSLPSAYEGSPYSATISASGGRTPYLWNMSVSPSCPSGLTCSGNSISGTPASGTAGTYTVTSTVNDTCTTYTKNFVLTINPSGGGSGACPVLSLTPPSGTSWSATVGTFFSQSITVSGGQTPYTNTQCTPASCNGLNLACTSSGATIAGAPTTAGTCTFSVSWQDSCTNPAPQTISGTYTVNITGLPPTCTLSASPGVVRYGDTAQLSWSITNGPSNGTFNPQSGTCTTFSGSVSGSCTTASLTTEGANTFTLTLSPGGNTCQTTLYVGCQNYRVWNDTGNRDYMIDGNCRDSIGNGVEITVPASNWYLNVGETITQYQQAGTCTNPTGQTLTYDQAMNADVVINGGNGNCQVNFSGSDR